MFDLQFVIEITFPNAANNANAVNNLNKVLSESDAKPRDKASLQ